MKLIFSSVVILRDAWTIFLLAAAIVINPISATQLNNEAKLENVMAAFVFNFTKFLEWPQLDSENFYICVLGKSKLVEPLNKIAEREKVKGRKIIITEIEDLSNLKSNSVLFLATDEENRLYTILRKTSGKSILTIGNSEGLAKKGVCINLVVTDNKMKFEINRKAIEDAGIIPNSRLLSLAVKIIE